MSTSTLTADHVRAELIARIDGYLTSSGMSASAFGRDAVKDDRFVKRIRDGGNFTVEMYQRVIDWIDAQERAAA